MAQQKISEQPFLSVIEALMEFKNDLSVPKNIQLRIDETILILSEKKSELSLLKSRAMAVLEELGEDVNMEPYTRTQLYNVVSMLDGLF
ncbi:UPF0147 family protein [Candidatus Woesearchaeota archaeon]|nr:UPF0147 family protein [Candidatus Woesearchaeota archaeon]